MEINIPRNLAGVEAQGGPGGAMMQVGESISRAGNAVGGFLDNIQKNYDYNAFTEIEKEFEPKLQEHYLTTTAKDDGSNPKAFEEYQKGREKILDEANNKASKINQRVGDFTKKHFTVRSVQYDHDAQKALYSNMIKKSVTVDGEQAMLSLDSALSRDGNPFENVSAAIEENKVKIFAREGLYGANTQTVFDGAISQALLYSVDNALKDPAKSRKVIEMMKDPVQKEKILSYIAPEHRGTILGLLKSTGEDTVRQDVYTDLFNKYKGDFNAMNEALSKPDVQKEYGIGLQDSFYIKNQISAAQADKEKSDATRHDKTNTYIFTNLKQMTPGKIDRMVVEGDIDYKSGEHWKSELKTLREGGPSDSMTYFRLYSQVKDSAGDQDAILRARKEIFSSGGLSFSDKKSLLSMTEGAEDKFEASVTKLGADYIKNVVMPSQTLISAAKPKEAENYLDAMKAFNEGISAARKRGEKIDADTVNKIAKDVASTHIMSLNDQIEAARATYGKNRGPKKDKYGYAIGEKKVIKGRTYTYIGNNQWQ